MATLAADYVKPVTSDDRFFLYTSIAMALTIVAGFGLQLAAGRSSFASPPIVHARSQAAGPVVQIRAEPATATVEVRHR